MEYSFAKTKTCFVLYISRLALSLSLNAKIGCASALKINEFILYCSRLALSLFHILLINYACLAEAFRGYLFDTDSIVALGVTSSVCTSHTKLYCRTDNEICF